MERLTAEEFRAAIELVGEGDAIDRAFGDDPVAAAPLLSYAEFAVNGARLGIPDDLRDRADVADVMHTTLLMGVVTGMEVMRRRQTLRDLAGGEAA